MIVFTARINAQAQIIEWRGADVRGDDESVLVQIRSESASDAWRLIETNSIAELHPVSEPEGKWTIDARKLEGVASGIEGSGRVPKPPLGVTVTSKNGFVIFTVKSAT